MIGLLVVKKRPLRGSRPGVIKGNQDPPGTHSGAAVEKGAWMGRQSQGMRHEWSQLVAGNGLRPLPFEKIATSFCDNSFQTLTVLAMKEAIQSCSLGEHRAPESRER